MASARPPQPQAITKVSISALVISLPIIYVSLLRVPPSALARDSTFWFLMSNSIIAIIAADSGVLFFSPAPHSHYDDDLPCSDVAPGEPAETVQEGYCDAMLSVPLMAPHEPVDVVSTSVVVGGCDQLPSGGAVSCKATDEVAGMEEGYELALIEGEGAAPASRPITDTDHASLLQIHEEEEEEVPEPLGSNKRDMMIVEGEQWIIIPQAQVAVTLDDQDEGSAEEMKPRCSVTEETDKSPPEEEPAYWQLSDEELNRKVEEFITRFNRDMVEQEAAVC